MPERTNGNGKWTFMLAGVILGVVMQGGIGWFQVHEIASELKDINSRLSKIETDVDWLKGGQKVGLLAPMDSALKVNMVQ